MYTMKSKNNKRNLARVSTFNAGEIVTMETGDDGAFWLLVHHGLLSH